MYAQRNTASKGLKLEVLCRRSAEAGDGDRVTKARKPAAAEQDLAAERRLAESGQAKPSGSTANLDCSDRQTSAKAPKRKGSKQASSKGTAQRLSKEASGKPQAAPHASHPPHGRPSPDLEREGSSADRPADSAEEGSKAEPAAAPRPNIENAQGKDRWCITIQRSLYIPVKWSQPLRIGAWRQPLQSLQLRRLECLTETSSICLSDNCSMGKEIEHADNLP